VTGGGPESGIGFHGIRNELEGSDIVRKHPARVDIQHSAKTL
jgi:hypothetical protein